MTEVKFGMNKPTSVLPTPVLVLASMYPIFTGYTYIFDERTSWFLGLVTYWIVWGTIFSLYIIDRKDFKDLITPRPLPRDAMILLMFAIIMVISNKFLGFLDYDKPNFWYWLMYITTAFGNGFFEEILWRGTFYDQFPDRPWIQMGWASLGFAIWHLAPGAISAGGNVWTLVIGAFFLGLLGSYLTRRSGTIGWAIIGHTVIGLITIA